MKIEVYHPLLLKTFYYIILYVTVGCFRYVFTDISLDIKTNPCTKKFYHPKLKSFEKKNPLFLVFWIFHIFSLSQSKCILVLKESAGSLLFQNVGVHGVLPY